jgi:hypothetical protein
VESRRIRLISRQPSEIDDPLAEPLAPLHMVTLSVLRSRTFEFFALCRFRSIEDQKDVFFGIKAERNQSAKERAKVRGAPFESGTDSLEAAHLLCGALLLNTSIDYLAVRSKSVHYLIKERR